MSIPSMARAKHQRIGPGSAAALVQVIACIAFAGIAYATTLGDARDALRDRKYTQAAGLLAPLAAKGDPEAGYVLAGLYRAGRGVEPDHARAFSLLLASATTGHADAGYSLAVMYERGWGTSIDLERAEHWYRAASRQGHRLALQRIERGFENRSATASSARKKSADLERIERRRVSKRSAKTQTTGDLSEALLSTTAELDSDGVSALVRGGADVHARDQAGRTPIVLAVLGANAAAVEGLLKHGASSDDSYQGHSILWVSAQAGESAIAALLLSAGASIYAADPSGSGPLQVASRGGHSATTRLLLEAGAPVDRSTATGNTALTLAARSGDAETVRALLAAGADVNHRNNTGDTPLILASGARHGEAVRALIASGAKVGLRNANGETAKAIAEAHGHNDIVALLRDSTPSAWSILGRFRRRPSAR